MAFSHANILFNIDWDEEPDPLSLLNPSTILKEKTTEGAMTHESIFRKSRTFSLK